MKEALHNHLGSEVGVTVTGEGGGLPGPRDINEGLSDRRRMWWALKPEGPLYTGSLPTSPRGPLHAGHY